MGINITADLSDVEVWDATRAGFTDVDPGLYEVTTESVDEHKATVKFTVKGSFGTTDLYLPKDMTKPPNKRRMKTALISHGAKADKINATGAALTISDPLFVGRKAWLLVTAVEGVDEQGRKKINDKMFLTPEQAAAWKKAAAEAKAASKANGAAAPAASAAPAATGKDAVADLLGLD